MEILRELWGFLENIPATFWGVVVGSFFSLGGVVISNRASERRLEKQFNHEMEQKRQDRESALRKEVYMAAAEAVSVGQATLGRFSNLEIANSEVTKEYLERAPSIGKVHVIANSETTRTLSRYEGELNEAFSKLWIKRAELQMQKIAISQVQNLIKGFEKTRDSMMEQVRQNNIEGTADQRKMDALNKNFEFEQKRILEHVEKQKLLTDEHLSCLIELSRTCSLETIRLGQLIVPILASIRNELGLQFNAVEYARIIEEQAKKQHEAIEQALGEWKERGFSKRVDEMIQKIID